MKKIALTLALALPLALFGQDTIIRSFNATVTFQSFVLTSSGRYSGTLSVNDQTNTYRGDSVKVGDYVFSPSATLFVIDTVSSANRFSAAVVIRRLSGRNVAPTGVGDVFRPTKNYKFPTFTADNQNGIPTQAQFIKLSGLVNRIDSLVYVVASASGGVADGDKGDIIVSSGGGVYTIDSAAVTGAKTNFSGRSGDATKLLGAQSNGTTDTVKVGTGLTLSSGIISTTGAVADGGTGLTTIPAGRLLVGNASSPIVTNNNLYWDTLNKKLFVGTGWVKTGTTVSSRITAFAADSSQIATGGHLLFYPGSTVFNNSAGFFASKNPNITGVTTVLAPEAALILGRPGIENESWGNIVRFDLSKYTSGQDPFTQLDIRLSQFDEEAANTPRIMTLRADGKVGINDTIPSTALSVNGGVTIKSLNPSGNPAYLIGAQSTGVMDSVRLGGAISFVNDTLTVKSSGIDSNMLASSSVTWAKLAQAVKDSIAVTGGGGGGSGTVTSITAGTGLTGGTITTSGTIAADTNFLVTVNDTAAMLTNYINVVDTATMLSTYINAADTASMLTNYINVSDTAAMLLTYINAADTAAILSTYINAADTAAMLTNYINVSDTSAMLNPYLKRTVDSIMFKTTYTATATTGEMIWNDQSGTVHLGMTGNIEMPLGQAEAHMVRNTTGSQIAKGKVVYINGATGQRPTIALADADSEGASSGTFGVTAEAIDNNDTGFVFISGYIKGINTNTIAPGSALWLDTVPGNFTTTKRVAPVHTVLVGYAVTQATNGTIFVKIANGQELGELHDVDVTSPVNGSLLRYNSTSAIWVDAQADSASIASNAIKNIHITNSAVNTSKLADSTVTALKIATATIANANIANATITAAKLVDSTITGVKLATGSVALNSATTTGTLPVEKGGTGLTTFGASGRVPYSTSASALTFDTIFRIDATNRNFQFGSGVMSGSRNIYIGDAETGVHRTSMGGAYNVGIGNNVGNNIGSTAFNNVMIGNAAGLNITSGDGNVLLNGGGGLTSGNNNIVIGVSAQTPTSTGSNNILIGQQVSLANPNSSNQLALGNVIFATSMDSTGTAIPVNGKVGILNNAPGTALDVNGVITATAFQPLILRRDINSNGSQVQQIFQLKNSSGTYVNYGAIASEIISNTAGKQVGSMRFSVIDSTDNGTLSNRFILGGNGLSAIGANLVTNPQKTLDVFGEMRIRDLDNGTATKLVGANNDGDLDSISIGSGLQLSAGVLSATGGGALTDGDKGDITVSGGGATWTIDSAAVTGAKTNFAGRAGDATRLLGAQSNGTTDTVQVGAGLTLSGGVLRSKSDTLAMIIAASDETTALTEGTAKVTFRAPFAMTITGLRANVNTASTSGIPTIDINETNVSIFSTRITIDVNEKTSVTAATAAVISDSAIADDAEMTIDIDTAGTGTKGLKITIYYIR